MLGRITVADDLAAALADVAWVQESVPEDLGIAQALWVELTACARRRPARQLDLGHRAVALHRKPERPPSLPRRPSLNPPRGSWRPSWCRHSDRRGGDAACLGRHGIDRHGGPSS
ncbi:MAG: hypothetical protein R3D28_23555 [Geminicoccaceae bacterium]